MSRILVIGPDIEEQLAAFRHYRETGYKFDRHVVGVDVLPAACKFYLNHVRAHIRNPEGALMDVFDQRFWRDETEQERLAGIPQSELQNALTGGIVISVFQKGAPGEKSVKVRSVLELPPGYEASLTPLREMQTFTGYLNETYRLEPVNEGEQPDIAGIHKYGWYRLDASGAVVEAMQCDIPGWMWSSWFVGPDDDVEAFKLKPGASPSLNYDAETDPGYAHCALRGAIDFPGMRRRVEDPAERMWDLAARGECYDHIFDEFPLGMGCGDEEKLGKPRDEFVRIAADKMLWFEYYIINGSRYYPSGFTSEEQLRNVNVMLEALPPGTLLTRVGFHD